MDAIVHDGPTLRLLVSFLFGFLIGLERYSHGRPAGLRTNLLVTVSSCLAMLLPAHFLPLVPGVGGIVDPTRIAAGALTGIGFLGAGVILKEGASVYGLTTAACIFADCVIGMAVGAGMFGPASLALALTLFALVALRGLERRIRQDRFRHVTVEIQPPADRRVVSEILHEIDVRHRLQGQRIDRATGRIRLTYDVQAREGSRFEEIVEELERREGVLSIHIAPLVGD